MRAIVSWPRTRWDDAGIALLAAFLSGGCVGGLAILTVPTEAGRNFSNGLQGYELQSFKMALITFAVVAVGLYVLLRLMERLKQPKMLEIGHR